MRLRSISIAALLLSPTVGCSCNDSTTAEGDASATETSGETGEGPGTSPPTTGSGTESDTGSGSSDTGEPEPPPPTSSKATVKFKGPTRLRNDLSRALKLDPNHVCNELGTLSCTDEVHTVALGGVEPFHLGIYEPPLHSAVTAPIVTDRVVLSACIERVDRDFAGSKYIFTMKLDGAELEDVDSEGTRGQIDRLYKLAVQRHATPVEIAHHRDLYRDILAMGTDAPARDWAVASCFAIFTSLEALFY